jgi:hypothetical protein
MAIPIAALVGLLPTITDALTGVARDFDILGDKQAERITGIASKALALVPEAIDAFAKLKATLGGREPTADDLRDLRMEIAAQSDEIADKRDQIHKNVEGGSDA